MSLINSGSGVAAGAPTSGAGRVASRRSRSASSDLQAPLARPEEAAQRRDVILVGPQRDRVDALAAEIAQPFGSALFDRA